MRAEANQLRRYLLGDLPEPEANEFDARLFADDKLLADLEEEQDSLI